MTTIDFFGPNSELGLYTQFRVMRPGKDGRLYPASQFWTDRELSRINPDKVYFFSPGLRPYNKNIVIGSFVAWLDLDGIDTLPNFHAEPSLIVRTGGGFHVYWRFTEFVYSDELASCLSDLVRVYPGADVICRDVTRFMRYPGSFNLKYSPPVKVDVVSTGGRDYDFQGFLRELMGLAEQTATVPPPHGALAPPVCEAATLYHCQTGNEAVDYRWYFWTKSQPYQIGSGRVILERLDGSQSCEVYALGGSVLLWSGLLREVPKDLRGYLTEVKVFL